MRNPKSKTIRKIGPASTNSILPLTPTSVGRASGPVRVAPRAVGNRTCHNSHNSHSSHSSLPSAAHPESSIQNPVSGIQHPASSIQPRSRNGKIARLPFEARDMVNRMLRNNIPHSQIVDALGELQFKVTERNISNWKTRGGYRDWCIAQDRALETRLLQDNLLAHLRTNDASQLAEVGLQLVATELSQFFLQPETRQQLKTEPEKLARTIGILCRLARQIHVLQKYRDQSAKELGEEHHPERLKRETDEALENLRDLYSAEKCGESINEPDISHRNFFPKNGFPADPPQDDPPRDDLELHRQNFQKLCDIIAARIEEAQSQTSASGSAPRAASSKPADDTEDPHHDTPADDQTEPDEPDQNFIPKNSLPKPPSNT